MKKLLKMLIVLFAFYIGLQFILKYFSAGHEINYTLKKDEFKFNVHESYFGKTNSYYFDISVNDNEFSFQVFENFGKAETIIKDIKYVETDRYKCLLPIFRKNQIIMDMMCLKDNVIYYYNNIKNIDSKIDNYIESLEIYKMSNWIDNKTEEITETPMIVYPNNILDNHYIGVNNYKGIYTISNNNFKKLANIPIFDADVYKRNIYFMMNQTYITVDYNSNYNFNTFFLVNLVHNRVTTISSNKRISFDSYIQGSFDNYFYVYDRESKIQYQVDINKKNVIEVGNSDIGIKFLENGEWVWKNVREFTNEDLKFTNNVISSKDNTYTKIDKIGDDVSGYYYYYKFNNNNYDVYRAPVRNANKLTYLFTVPNTEDVYYYDNYIYFSLINNKDDYYEVKYYNDSTGVRTIFKNNEFKFNETLKYHIYIEK